VLGKRKDNPPPDTAIRADRARREGRFQQALELVKLLHKAEPTSAHLELLKQTYLDRGRQLASQGHLRDAATTLEAAARVDAGNRAWLETLATEIARCGEPARALALLGPAAALPPALFAALADASITAEGQLPPLAPGLLAERQHLLDAFGCLEKGDDDGVRESLQAIGLKSPFLEWKLLLRGLQAYYLKDDARALDNWQRLAVDRAPAKLAAPFRAALDSAFLAAQPQTTQSLIRAQFDRMAGSRLQPALTAVRLSLGKPDNLAQAFRQVETILPQLRREAPDLATRLAICFYWAIMQTGPDDIRRYQRVFGTPVDDPHFHRLNALAYDQALNFAEAHRHWGLYEADIAANPGAWSPRADLARALVWLHMGRVARNVPTEAQRKRMPLEISEGSGFPKPLNPSAETCFRRALEFAPDLLDAHRDLFNHLLYDLQQPGKAEKVGRTLLEKFPNDIDTLEALADIRRDKGDDIEALALRERAVKHNPLDRRLRDLAGLAHLRVARLHTLKKDYEKAGEHLNAARELVGDQYQVWAWCQAVANYIRAGDTERAEQMRQEAMKVPLPLELSFLSLVEAIRSKLPPAIKKQHEKEFNDGLNASPDGGAAAALARNLALFEKENVDYVGLKSHTSKILKYINKARNLDLPEPLLLTLCGTLALLKTNPRAFRSFIDTARRKYPNNPDFLVIEATQTLDAPDGRFRPWMVERLLDEASRLTAALPQGARKDTLGTTIKGLRERLQTLNPFGGLFNVFGRMSGFEDFEDVFYDDE
jgi:tetratricopeptide (TPR) repeat protein